MVTITDTEFDLYAHLIELHEGAEGASLECPEDDFDATMDALLEQLGY